MKCSHYCQRCHSPDSDCVTMTLGLLFPYGDDRKLCNVLRLRKRATGESRVSDRSAINCPAFVYSTVQSNWRETPTFRAVEATFAIANITMIAWTGNESSPSLSIGWPPAVAGLAVSSNRRSARPPPPFSRRSRAWTLTLRCDGATKKSMKIIRL